MEEQRLSNEVGFVIHHISLLQEMPIFGAISETSMQLLLDHAFEETYAAGDYLFRKGDDSDGLYVIEKGKVVVQRHSADETFVLGTLSQGDCVGEMSLLDMHPRSADVLAQTETTAIHLSTMSLYKLRKANLEQFTTIQLNLARELSRRLRRTDEQLFEMMMQVVDIVGHEIVQRSGLSLWNGAKGNLVQVVPGVYT